MLQGFKLRMTKLLNSLIANLSEWKCDEGRTRGELRDKNSEEEYT